MIQCEKALSLSEYAYLQMLVEATRIQLNARKTYEAARLCYDLELYEAARNWQLISASLYRLAQLTLESA